MKNIVLIILMTVIYSGCNSHQLTIHGNMNGYNGEVVIVRNSASGFDTLGVTDVKNGILNYEIHVGDVCPLSVRNEKQAVQFFAGDGDTISILCNSDRWNMAEVLGGGTLQKSWMEYLSFTIQKDNEIASIRQDIRNSQEQHDLFWTMVLRAKIDSVKSSFDEKENNFIGANDNVVAAYVIFRQRNSLLKNKVLGMKCSLMGEKALSTEMGKELIANVNALEKMTIGKIAPIFSLPTLNGDTICLTEIKGNIIVVDFWASWCGPCRASFPHLKSIYEKYKDRGLNIIGVSLDSKHQAWEKAVEAEKLPWKQVSDLNAWDSEIVKLYGITGIPYMWVLDSNYRIVADNPSDKEFQEILIKQFGE